MNSLEDWLESTMETWREAFEVQMRCMLLDAGQTLQALTMTESQPMGETTLVDFTLDTGGCDFAIVPGSALFMARKLDENEAEYQARYKKCFHANLRYPEFKTMVHSLKGRRIGILGTPKPTIADTVKEYLDGL